MVWSDLARPPLFGVALRRALVPEPVAWLDVLAQSPSTNVDLLARAPELPDRSLLITDHQTAGQGRLGRGWDTPARAAITMSLLLRPVGVATDSISWLPLLTGTSVARTLRAFAGVDASVKWPNDVLLATPDGHRKVAGILLQQSGDAVVIGIGLNVSQSPSELPVPTATSLALAGAAVTDRDPLLRRLIRDLVDHLTKLRAGGSVAALVIETMHTLGRRVRVDLVGGTALVGEAIGLGPSGELLVRDDDGAEHPVRAGDVHHLRPDATVDATEADAVAGPASGLASRPTAVPASDAASGFVPGRASGEVVG